MKNIAVLTPNGYTFKRFKDFTHPTNSDIVFKHIREIRDVRGLQFIGYVILYDAMAYKDWNGIHNAVLARIKN